MKRWLVVIMVVLFLAGCGTAARESGYYEHNTHFKSWEHMKFSLWGYKDVKPVEVKMSKEGAWWGIQVDAPRR
jgi:uncharacterized protein YceK